MSRLQVSHRKTAMQGRQHVRLSEDPACSKARALSGLARSQQGRSALACAFPQRAPRTSKPPGSPSGSARRPHPGTRSALSQRSRGAHASSAARSCGRAIDTSPRSSSHKPATAAPGPPHPTAPPSPPLSLALTLAPPQPAGCRFARPATDASLLPLRSSARSAGSAAASGGAASRRAPESARRVNEDSTGSQAGAAAKRDLQKRRKFMRVGSD